MILGGIDYSLTGPAICIFLGEEDDDPFNFYKCKFHFLTNTNKYATTFPPNIKGEKFIEWNHDCERYRSIADWAIEKVQGCEWVILEGYSYNSKNSKVFNIAENTGVLKYKLWENAYPVDIVSPAEVKKLATGKGNATKKDMHSAFVKDTGVNLKKLISPKIKTDNGPVSDIVDSYYICKKLYNKMRMSSY